MGIIDLEYSEEIMNTNSEKNDFLHKPVLLNETIENLDLSPGKIIVDCTVGSGGHASAILEKILPNGFLIGIDIDKKALSIAEKCLNKYGTSFKLVYGNFKDIIKILGDLHIKKVDGFLLDLGISSLQLEDPQRGFSFRYPGPLDMRMDTAQKFTAFDLINYMDEENLKKLLKNNSQERFAKKIVHEVILARKKKKIETTTELVEIVLKAVPMKYRYSRIHPATRTFQALRMAVNNELENLSCFLDNFFDLLSLNGRIVVISFHSLEDRLVKDKFRNLVKEGKFKILTKKPIRPSVEEVSKNIRSRSAKLRVGERVK